MKPRIYSLENCAEIRGTAVVIDVLRAFTTAAYAFQAGAASILLAGTPQQAFDLRAKDPALLLAGEVDGRPIPGFNLGNSPTQIRSSDLSGMRLVLRTSAGTQGVLRCGGASQILAASLVNMGATVRHLQRSGPTEIGFVATGLGDHHGEEDVACAEAGIQLLQGAQPDWDAVCQAVQTSSAAVKFLAGNDPDFPSTDLDAALQVNHFNFTMVVQRCAGLWFLAPQSVS